MSLPKYFRNPFNDKGKWYPTADVLANISVNDLQLVMFSDIFIDEPHTIEKIKIVGADTRYPPLVYESSNISQKYCTFDGRHRLLKLKSEGKTATVCFIVKPKVFEKLTGTNFFIPCSGCAE
tara:strand:+ start:619 stop:984 length:366 start_codon:yes stop_codon:yes gene_type:complete